MLVLGPASPVRGMQAKGMLLVDTIPLFGTDIVGISADPVKIEIINARVFPEPVGDSNIMLLVLKFSAIAF